MSIENIQLGLSIAGGVAVALPVVLRAIRLLLVAIPGDQHEASIEALELRLEKLAKVITGLDLKRDVVKEEKVEGPSSLN